MEADATPTDNVNVDAKQSFVSSLQHYRGELCRKLRVHLQEYTLVLKWKILRHAFGKRHCADSKEGGD